MLTLLRYPAGLRSQRTKIADGERGACREPPGPHPPPPTGTVLTHLPLLLPDGLFIAHSKWLNISEGEAEINCPRFPY